MKVQSPEIYHAASKTALAESFQQPGNGHHGAAVTGKGVQGCKVLRHNGTHKNKQILDQNGDLRTCSASAAQHKTLQITKGK